MPTYVETITGGVSTIVCEGCGEVVVNERAHERQHAASAPVGPDDGVEDREEG